MATSKRISEFDAVPALSGSEEYILEKAGVAYKATLNNMSEYKRYGKFISNSVSGSLNLDLSQYDFFSVTVTGDVSISISSYSASVPFSFILRLKQDAVGNRAITWDTMFKFPNNTEYSLPGSAQDVEWFVGHVVEPNIVELLKADGPFNFSA